MYSKLLTESFLVINVGILFEPLKLVYPLLVIRFPQLLEINQTELPRKHSILMPKIKAIYDIFNTQQSSLRPPHI